MSFLSSLVANAVVFVAARISLVLETIDPTPGPSPTDVLRPGLSQWDVSPGLLGFIVMFVVALAGVAVWFSMAGKLRKIRFDERREAGRAAGSGQDDVGSDA